MNSRHAQEVSDRFCGADSDITFRSCDEILFKVHRKNLETASEGFSPPEGTAAAESEVVSLTEDGKTLELLFQYMYPQRHPDLTKIDFMQLAELAEAAEKYQVYAAMDVCNIRMDEAFSDHSFEVMMYAMRHGYPELMDKSERKALEVSPTIAFESFTPQVYIAWTRYYAQWLDLLASLHIHMANVHGDHDISDHHWGENKWMLWIVTSLDRPAALLKLDSFFESSVYESHPLRGMRRCERCKNFLTTWRDGHMKQEIERMKKLSSFL
ncbi:hypothetical protein FIBSPDRAFT_310403 [Athelia psychrophila]|uniref:BTB domain-containing protein n=1 Tax=Athelia psychrophila TaxID=1759441 RepID=A0A166WAQ0_9AGAM|nr:hypothetical protein FIBSPDRAFT_310403 [Fibularhizoctonia sp. CBS 109695]